MTTHKILNIHEIKAYFSRYASQVMKGKSFIIAHRNKPFAELRPLEAQAHTPLCFGVLRGEFEVPSDFNAALDEFEKSFYGN